MALILFRLKIKACSPLHLRSAAHPPSRGGGWGVGLLLFLFISTISAQDYPIRPVPFTSVKVTDNFWAPRIKTNHEVTIPIALKHCYSTGRVDNFLIAGGLKNGKFLTQYTFDDTDIYKIIEGASYSLQTFPDKELETHLDALIYYVGRAQEPDGYLYTARTIDPANPPAWAGKKRWEMDWDLSHELYNCGHLYEAAVAHYQATGKRNLLDIAIKNADLVCRDFGPGKLAIVPGHQVIEMGLVKLYRATSDRKYLDMAKFFLDIRGKNKEHTRGEYCQDHIGVCEQTTAVGHAVRATYMYSGMADVAALLDEKAYIDALDKIWNDIITSKYYITGGIGAAGGHEGFSGEYDLPNMSAYNETCASIGDIYWNYRMFLLEGDSKFYDIVERTLYNGMISGVSLSGDRFFYPNPLESNGQHSRSEWFGCACCPSNVCRFIPSMPGYMYAFRDNRIYVNLFVQSTAKVDLPQNPVELIQHNNYPWEGQMEIIVNPHKAANFEMAVRIPGWAQNKPVPSGLYTYSSTTKTQSVQIKVNGKVENYKMEKGYALINRQWNTGDVVSFTFAMDVHKVLANSKVKADNGKMAYERGPVLYCFEWPDNNGHVRNLLVDKNAKINSEYRSGLLDGVVVLTGEATATKELETKKVSGEKTVFTAIPYYAWANRGAGEMMVWAPYEKAVAKPTPAPTIASKSKASASIKSRALSAINDRVLPQNSNDREASYIHWWPKKDTLVWVEYTFEKPETVKSCNVYWFDDGPWGGCRIPAAWKILYRADDQWIPVENTTPYEIAKDKANSVKFKPVNTSGLRLEIVLPKNNSSGIYEWEVE